MVACTVHEGGVHYVALYHGAFLLFSPEPMRMAVRQSKGRARSSVLLEAVKEGVNFKFQYKFLLGSYMDISSTDLCTL